MHRVSGFLPFTSCFLLSCHLLCSPPSFAQQHTPPPTAPLPDVGSTQVRNLSVNGRVTDGVNHSQLDNAKVELRPFGGGLGKIAFTDGSGSFQLNDVAPGDYTLVVDRTGYQAASLQVEVQDFSVHGVQVELVRTPDASTAGSDQPSTVSLRELSIPRKAHDDMEKGMALLYGKSDYLGSLKLFQRATQEYPDYYEAYTQIGVAYMGLTDAANSEKAFRRSIEVSQDRYAEAYIGLGELFLKAGRFTDAEPLLRKASEIDSRSWQADSQLARALVGLHRPSEAETSALAAIALSPDNAELYLVLANAHDQLQNERALLDDLNHYLKLAPTGPFAEQARLSRDKVQRDLAASQASPTTQP
jgi:tetratricopeptide (TPR) repeat protein